MAFGSSQSAFRFILLMCASLCFVLHPAFAGVTTAAPPASDPEDSPDAAVTLPSDNIPEPAPHPAVVKRSEKKKKKSKEDGPDIEDKVRGELDENDLSSKMFDEYEMDIMKIKGLSEMLKDLENSLKEMKLETVEKYSMKKKILQDELNMRIENISFRDEDGEKVPEKVKEIPSEKEEIKTGKGISKLETMPKEKIAFKNIETEDKGTAKPKEKISKQMERKVEDRSNQKKTNSKHPKSEIDSHAEEKYIKVQQVDSQTAAEALADSPPEHELPEAQVYQPPPLAAQAPVADTILPPVVIQDHDPVSAPVPPQAFDATFSANNEPLSPPVAVSEPSVVVAPAPPVILAIEPEYAYAYPPAEADHLSSVPASPPTPASSPVVEVPATHPVIDQPVPAPVQVQTPEPTPIPSPPLPAAVPEYSQIVTPSPASAPVVAPAATTYIPVPQPDTVIPGIVQQKIQSEGLINKFVATIFGKVTFERDSKWAKPWKTHQEHMKVPSSVEQRTPVSNEAGFIGKTINKIVTAIFGTIIVERDPKWAQPWQTHTEHRRKVSEPDVPRKIVHVPSTGIIHTFICTVFGVPKIEGERDSKWTQPWQTHLEHQRKIVEPDVPKQKVQIATGGIIDKFICTIFGNPKTTGERDPKWDQPWQTHEEQQKKSQASETVQEKVVVKATGGILDNIIRIIFPGPAIERDPKYARPWQTHDEHKKNKEVVFVEKVKVGNSGGLVDKFVVSVFNLKSDIPRDPKWAKPWQTHEENIKQVEVSKTPVKQTGGLPGFGFLDKFVTLVFKIENIERDPKWSQPWQTHAEHKKSVPEAPTERKPVIITGGILDSIVKSIFNLNAPVGKRDPKWAQPWKTHEDKVKPIRPVTVPPPVAIHPPAAAPALPVAAPALPVATPLSPVAAPTPHVATPPPQVTAPAPPPVATPVPPVVASVPSPVAAPAPKVVAPDSPPVAVPASPAVETPTAVPVAAPLPTPSPTKPSTAPPPPPPPMSKAEEPKPVEKPVEKEQPRSSQKDESKFPSTKTAGSAEKMKPKQKSTLKRVTSSTIETFPETNKKERAAASIKPKREREANDITETAPNKIRKESKSKDASKTLHIQPKKEGERRQENSDISQDTERQEKKSNSIRKNKKLEDKVKNFPVECQHCCGNGQARDSGTAEEAQAAAPAARPSLVADAPTPTSTPQKTEYAKEDQEEQIIIVPTAPRSREHIESILGLDDTARDASKKTDTIAEATLKDLKNIYGASIKPLEGIYKYQDISNRHMSDAEIFNQPIVLMLGPYSTGKSSFLNYLMGLEYTRRALRTGASPSHGVFRIIQYGSEDHLLDGTAISADKTFASLQKFGQNFVDQLRGHALNVPLLKKVTFVESPGILEMRRAGERVYPFNDVLQWFIDRADLVLVMFDYTKLDAGYELEAVLDQLKGREAQVRILLNKADQIPPEELIKVQGSLFWNLSPLLGVSAPPTVYAGSFSSRPYRESSPARLFQAQEEALLHDIAKSINSRVDNRVAIARRHAVRVRNHAQMVDTYLTTYNKNKGFLTSKHKLAEDIVENPHLYNIYEGMSLLTNISRYDLPDPEVYRDFFKLHNLYDFPTLKGTCSYLHGCPLDKIDGAISTALPELLAHYRRLLSKAGVVTGLPYTNSLHGDRSSTFPDPQQSKGL